MLVHYYTKQDPRKHQQAFQLIEQAIADGLFLISTLSLNELSFVLAKLKINRDVINSHLSELYLTKPEAILLKHFKRAAEIAYQVSFHHSNDCLHTAIAEELCDELITFNRSDFQLIQHHTRLKISVL